MKGKCIAESVEKFLVVSIRFKFSIINWIQDWCILVRCHFKVPAKFCIGPKPGELPPRPPSYVVPSSLLSHWNSMIATPSTPLRPRTSSSIPISSSHASSNSTSSNSHFIHTHYLQFHFVHTHFVQFHFVQSRFVHSHFVSFPLSSNSTSSIPTSILIV